MISGSESGPGGGRSETRDLLLTATALLLTVGWGMVALFALPSRLLENPLVLPSAAVAASASTAVAVLRPRWIFYGFLLACMTAPQFLEEISLPLGFMKLYIQDVIFLFCAVVIAARISVGRTTWPLIPFNRMVFIYLILGIWATAVGLRITGHAMDYTLGDFRRAFFYFMNYFVVILLTDGLRDTRKIRTLLIAGGVLIVLKGMFQALTGQFYYRRFGDPAHILSHYELTFLSFGIFAAVAHVMLTPRKSPSGSLWRSHWKWSVLAASGCITTFIGNYRASWLGLLGGFILIFCFLPRRGKMALAGLGALGALFLALALTVMWDVRVEGYSTLGEDIMAKASVQNTAQDVNVTWRFESYHNAFRLWTESPWIGRGLGEELEFSTSTSTGSAMMSRGHRVHNSFLWLLMSLGVTGFAVFLWVQGVYFVTLVRYIRSSAWIEGRATVLACAAFYVSFMISTSFEIFLESAMPITVLSSSMALAMLTIHYTPSELASPPTA